MREGSSHMVESIARQSVVIKCNLHASIMLGNYEFYYAAGLVHKLTGHISEQIASPQEMIEEVHSLLKDYHTEDEHELHLIRMLKDYEPTEQFDEQMKDLYRIGQQEQNMWQEKMSSY